MSRRRGFLYHAIKASQAAGRQHEIALRRQAAAVTRDARERARQVRQAAAQTKEQQREDQREHVRQQEGDASTLNDELDQQVRELGTLLSDGLTTACPLDFESLKHQPETPPFQPGVLATIVPEPTLDKYVPPPLRGFRRLMPPLNRAYERATELALRHFEIDRKKYEEREASREKALAEARAVHQQLLDKLKHEADEWNAQIDQFARDYSEGQPAAITDYCRLALDGSDYPEGFPKAAKTAYVPDSKQLVVEYELPTLDAVPEMAAYKYVKSKDEIVPTQRSSGQRRNLYASIVAQVTIRTLHELFEARHVETIVFNGHVTAIDKGTGQQVHPCIVTVRTSRDVFAPLNLANVDPQACLKTLNASVSPSPHDLVAVRPVLEFNMVDRRFVQEADVLSTLDQRPNLMELSPTEFESLITNLFERMGLETRQTQASRDGGVDCVAFDARPIFGGKVVIQAKRYKNTVGVSAVRDLYGTVQNEGASKGILVTTSGYGKASFDFANGKPLELLSGSHLLFLLEQHAGIKAKIEVPDTWNDPAPDSAPHAESP